MHLSGFSFVVRAMKKQKREKASLVNVGFVKAKAAASTEAEERRSLLHFLTCETRKAGGEKKGRVKQ